MLCLSNLAHHLAIAEDCKNNNNKKSFLLESLDDLGIIKDIIARDNQFIISLSLPQSSYFPEVSPGKEQFCKIVTSEICLEIKSIYNFITIKCQYFTIDIDSNRIKLLPHWRLEIQKPQGTNQQRVCNEVPNLTETEACYRCSDIPRYGTKDNCNI